MIPLNSSIIPTESASDPAPVLEFSREDLVQIKTVLVKKALAGSLGAVRLLLQFMRTPHFNHAESLESYAALLDQFVRPDVRRQGASNSAAPATTPAKPPALRSSSRKLNSSAAQARRLAPSAERVNMESLASPRRRGFRYLDDGTGMNTTDPNTSRPDDLISSDATAPSAASTSGTNAGGDNRGNAQGPNSPDFQPLAIAAQSPGGVAVTPHDIAASAAAVSSAAEAGPKDSARWAAETGIDETVIERLMKNRRRRSNHIGLFGPMGVGKTTYLACLYLALDAHGYLNHELTDADTNAFLGWFVQNLQRGKLPPSTQQSWEIQVGVTRNGKNQKVRLRDIPGGWFTEESAWKAGVRSIEHQLRQCTGSMFFIDTEMLLSTSPDAPQRRYLNRVVDRAIRRTQRSLKAQLTGIRKPVAICFTKSDRLTRDHAPDVLTAEDDDTLRRQKADYLWSLLGRFDTVFHEGGYEHARYFAVSALGGISGDVQAPKPPDQIVPAGVLDPFFFLLEASRTVVKKQRRRVAAVATFLFLATVGTLAGLGLAFHNQTALPAYHAISAALADTTQPLKARVEMADRYLSEWDSTLRRISTLNLIADEVTAIKAQRDALWLQMADERYKNLAARADALLEADAGDAAIGATERYRGLLGEAQAFAVEFPNQRADDVREMIKALEIRYERRMREQTDAERWQAFLAEFETKTESRERLDALGAYLSTLPGEKYREQAERLRSTEFTAIRTRIEREMVTLIADEERTVAAELDGRAYSLGELAEKLQIAMARVRLQLERWRLQYEPAAPELGEFFIAKRRALQDRFADRELDLTFARFEAENWPAKRRAEALLDYLMRHPDAPRKQLVDQRLHEMSQREVERGFAELALAAGSIATRETLVAYLDRLRDFRDSHPTFSPTPGFAELDIRARIAWPRNTITPMIEQSRTAAVWNDSARALAAAGKLREIVIPFESETAIAEIVELVGQAKTRATQLTERAAEVDYQTVRRQYLDLFGPLLKHELGRQRLATVRDAVAKFSDKHHATLSEGSRTLVEQWRAFMDWIAADRDYEVVIARADFSEGSTHNAYIRFDWTADGQNWVCVAETSKIKNAQPTWNHRFILRWKAFDTVHVKGHYDGMFSSGVFYAHTRDGFLALLDLTAAELPNQWADGKRSHRLRVELAWPAGAPTPIRTLPDRLPE